MPMPGVNIISGASSPLGQAYCKYLVGQGEKCIAIINKNNPFTDPNIEVWHADLSIEKDIQKICNNITGRNVWSYVHLAASSIEDDLDITMMQKVFTVNVFSAWRIAEECMQNMPIGGRILFVGSVGHKFGGKVTHTAYSASKYTLEYYPKIFRDCAQANILVNTLQLGVMQGGTQDKMKANMTERVKLIPTRKTVLHSEAIRNISFLCSPGNRSIHNTILSCTGGE